MDLAVTFHVGLCIRIPRSQKQKLSDLPIEPLAECYRYMTEASDALDHAQEVADYQAIGVRCREALLAFTNAAQIVMPWSFGTGAPTHPHFSQVGRSHSISDVQSSSLFGAIVDANHTLGKFQERHVYA